MWARRIPPYLCVNQCLEWPLRSSANLQASFFSEKVQKYLNKTDTCFLNWVPELGTADTWVSSIGMNGWQCTQTGSNSNRTWRSLNFCCRNCSALSLLPCTRLPCILEFLGDLYCNILGRFYAQTCKRNESLSWLIPEGVW